MSIDYASLKRKEESYFQLQRVHCDLLDLVETESVTGQT